MARGLRNISLTLEDFQALVRGRVVTKKGGVGEVTRIILNDIGWKAMSDELLKAQAGE